MHKAPLKLEKINLKREVMERGGESFQSEVAEVEEEVDRWPEGGGGETTVRQPDRNGERCGE